MHLRLPIVAGIVATAGIAALVRGGSPPAVRTALALATAVPAAGRAPAGRPGVAAGRRDGGPARRANVVVYVAGDVMHPGVYTLPATARAVDALHAAGGATAAADMVAVNLAKPLVDGEEVAFPAQGTALAVAARSRRTRSVPRASTRVPGVPKGRRKRRPSAAAGDAASAGPDEVVDLNVADESALETLPGIGAALAERIALVRQQSGPFGSLDDLLDVSGMTQSKLDAIAPYVTLH